MKRFVKKLIRNLGYDIVPYEPNYDMDAKSVRSNRLTLHETATGKYFLPTDARADVVANAIINNEIFDKEVVDIAKKYIKPETVVLDVGSNFGQMSILFSEWVGSSGKVHAFDADDFVFEILRKNIDINGKSGKIIPHFGAVHHTDGETLRYPVQDFNQFSSYGSYGIDPASSEGRPVRSFTIDSLDIQEPISFMKIDIQGGDLQAMQGAVRTIRRNKMPILFEYEYQVEEQFNFNFQQYVSFVEDVGYKFLRVIGGHNFLIIPK